MCSFPVGEGIGNPTAWFGALVENEDRVGLLLGCCAEEGYLLGMYKRCSRTDARGRHFRLASLRKERLRPS